MDELEFFTDVRVVGPIVLRNDGDKVKYICTIATRWKKIASCSLSCGNRTEFICTRSTGVHHVEREELEASFAASVGMKGIAGLKSDVKSKTGIEVQLEERKEEQEKFPFESPNCERVTFMIYQLIREYVFSYRDKRSSLWRRKSYDIPVMEETRHMYVDQTLPVSDPSCGCKNNPKQKKEGLISLFLGAMGMAVHYVQHQGRVDIPTLNLSFGISSVQELYGITYLLKTDDLPSFILMQEIQGKEEVVIKFSPHVENASTGSPEVEPPDLERIARSAVAEVYELATKRETGELAANRIQKSNSLEDLYIHDINELYNAKNQILDAIPTLIDNASSHELKQMLKQYLEETRRQKERLEKVFDIIGESPIEKKNLAVMAIVKVGMALREEFGHEGSIDSSHATLLDSSIITSVQRLEHYEIASYGTTSALAKQLGGDEDLELLMETLGEKKLSDERLNQIAKRIANLNSNQSRLS